MCLSFNPWILDPLVINAICRYIGLLSLICCSIISWFKSCFFFTSVKLYYTQLFMKTWVFTELTYPPRQMVLYSKTLSRVMEEISLPYTWLINLDMREKKIKVWAKSSHRAMWYISPHACHARHSTDNKMDCIHGFAT